MKWKRSKKSSSEAKAKVSPEKNKPVESNHAHAQSKPEEKDRHPASLPAPVNMNTSAFLPAILPVKESNNNAQLEPISMVTSSKTLANENVDPRETRSALNQSELSHSFSAEEEDDDDGMDSDSRIINVTA